MNQSFVPVINRFLHWFKVGIISPILILMVLSKGVNIESIGLISAVLSISVLIFEVPSGILSDRFGRRRIYLISLLLDLIGISIVLFSNQFIYLAIGFMVYGIARAFSSGSIESLYIDSFIKNNGKDNLHHLITVMGIGEAAGLAIGALIGGVIPMQYRLVAPNKNMYNGNLMIQFGVIVILMCLTYFSSYRDIPSEKEPVKHFLADGYQFIKTNKIVKWLLVGSLSWGFAFNAVELFWQPQLKNILGSVENTWVFGVMNSGYFIAAIGGSFLIGYILAKIKMSPFKIMSILRFCIGASIILLALQHRITGFTVFFLLIMGFNGMLNIPEGTVFNKEVPESKRASLLSVSSLVMQLGGAIGAMVYSFVKIFASINIIWIIAGSVFAVTAILYWRLAYVER